ncbi:WD repeat-containing protein, putative [Plasmodium ovale wallikeri]|uniref:WD repeat-containing protein, putative n=2 Tax=Plasmodium ovale TaxID=36330 RepID=A0A1C3L5J8_PLAOA|nr:WD repeat-containing protein, putative [Plasmodium ovale wallikeri]SBT82637.1 WD repeat-containing protein, putative [Plasmodium ovale]
MEQNKVMLVYDNQEILLVNVDNERCENKFDNFIKDHEKKICILKNGNFLVLHAKRKTIKQYLCTKNNEIFTKHVSVYLNVIKLTKNEKIIFGGDKTGNIYVWSAITGLLINSFQAHFGPVKDILIDQTVNVIYTYSDDNTVHVYNLHDLFKKKKIKPILFYQHDINSSIKQIHSITPNMYNSYYTLITLTSNGNLYIWGLKSRKAIHVLKTNKENCTHICSNEPFNTHLYLCKGSKIFRIPFVQLCRKGEYIEQNVSNKEKKNFQKINEYSDYVQVNKREKAESDTCENVPENLHRKADESTVLQNDAPNVSYLNLKNCTVFIGHKNEVIKCHVNDKKQVMISLAKDGIKVWDIYNCYAIKTLKYGENVIDFYVPTINHSSYQIEFPNLLLEYENDTKINIVYEMKEDNCIKDCSPILDQDENMLINMANMFAGHGI